MTVCSGQEQESEQSMSGERGTESLLQRRFSSASPDSSTCPGLSLHLPCLPLFFSFVPPSCVGPGSCIAPAHAGSQHQSTLMRDLWVFNHALPQPLFLSVRVHPVYLAPVTRPFWGERNKNVFALLELPESPEEINSPSTHQLDNMTLQARLRISTTFIF